MRLKTKGILFDQEQAINLLLGEKETSVFLKVLDKERPLDKINLDEKKLNDLPSRIVAMSFLWAKELSVSLVS